MLPLVQVRAWLLFALAACVAGQAPQNTCSRGLERRAGKCIQNQGEPYLSSFCSSQLQLTTPTSTETATSISTITVESTSTTDVRTITEPATTETITRVEILNSTSTITTISTEVTATYTSFSATTTATSTSITYVFTCGSSITSVSIPSSSSSFHFGNSTSVPMGTGSVRPSISSRLPNGNLSISTSWLPTGTGRWSTSLWSYGTPLAKRQRAPNTIPVCVSRYGELGASAGCRCLNLPTPAATTTTRTVVDPATTATSTSIVKVQGTTSSTPTETATDFITSTKTIRFTTTSITSVASTVFTVFTQTVVTTTTSFTSLPTPSSFNIYYVNPAANETEPSNNFFHAVPTREGNGVMLAPEAMADNFRIDELSRLVDITTGGFITKNTVDFYPFEYVQTGAATANTPVCEACNGIITCNYPGTTRNVFALCYGLLALGQPGIFGKDADQDGLIDCVPITLQYK